MHYIHTFFAHVFIYFFFLWLYYKKLEFAFQQTELYFYRIKSKNCIKSEYTIFIFWFAEQFILVLSIYHEYKFIIISNYDFSICYFIYHSYLQNIIL